MLVFAAGGEVFVIVSVNILDIPDPRHMGE
jgi:hypothetical protein